MNICEYDVIYKEKVYKCIDMIPEFCGPISADLGVKKPRLLYVTCIDSDGHVISLHDETVAFRFIRKASEA